MYPQLSLKHPSQHSTAPQRNDQDDEPDAIFEQRIHHSMNLTKESIVRLRTPLAPKPSHLTQFIQSLLRACTSVIFTSPIPEKRQSNNVFSSSKLSICGSTPGVALNIFDRLDLVISTCAGLTCKFLYAIHKSVYGKVLLERPIPGDIFSVPPLVDLNKGEMALGVVYCGLINIFGTLERSEEVRRRKIEQDLYTEFEGLRVERIECGETCQLPVGFR